MTTPLLIPTPDAAGDVSALHALAAVEAALDRPPAAVTAGLLDYYAPDSPQCGVSFLDGSETASPDAVTASDLFAVTCFGLTVPPAVARRLLHDTPHAARIAAWLAPGRLPVDATLTDADGLLLHAMGALHEAVAAAFGSLPDEQAHATASAICARKRPELFPALDRDLRVALGLPSAAMPRRSWLILRSLVRDEHVAREVSAAYARARAAAPGLSLDVYPLRQLHVLTCHVRISRIH